jgi:hypothetical protein
VIVPGSAEVQASFAPVAKHYGAVVVPCPPRFCGEQQIGAELPDNGELELAEPGGDIGYRRRGGGGNDRTPIA